MIIDYEKENKKRMYKFTFVILCIIIIFMSLFLIICPSSAINTTEWIHNSATITVDSGVSDSANLNNLYDKNPSTICNPSSLGFPVNITEDFGAGTSHIVNNITFWARDHPNVINPDNWLIFGSNDNVYWNLLNTQVNQNFTQAQKRIFTYTNFNSYRYIRINILHGYDPSQIALAEIQYSYDDMPTPTPTPTPILPTFNGLIYPIHISKNSITWNVTSEFNITSVSNDGIIILNYDNASKMFTENNLKPSTYHTFCITPICNTTETLPEDIKSSDLFFDFLVKYGLIILIIGLMFAGFKLPLVSIVAFIFAFIAFIAALPQGDFWMDIIYIVLLMGSTMVTYVGVRK